MKQPLLCKSQFLTGHIVQVAGQFDHLLRRIFRFSQQGTQAVCPREIFSSQAKTDLLNPHHWHIPELCDKVFQQSSPGRCAELPANLSAVNRDFFQQFLGCGGRDRQFAVSAAHGTAAHMDR